MLGRITLDSGVATWVVSTVAIPEFVGSLVLLGWVIPLTRRLRRGSLPLFESRT